MAYQGEPGWEKGPEEAEAEQVLSPGSEEVVVEGVIWKLRKSQVPPDADLSARIPDLVRSKIWGRVAEGATWGDLKEREARWRRKTIDSIKKGRMVKPVSWYEANPEAPLPEGFIREAGKVKNMRGRIGRERKKLMAEGVLKGTVKERRQAKAAEQYEKAKAELQVPDGLLVSGVEALRKVADGEDQSTNSPAQMTERKISKMVKKYDPMSLRGQRRVRSEIKAVRVVRVFQACVEGAVNLSPTQVRCGEILLRKVLPDLQSLEIAGEVNVTEMSDLELRDKMAKFLQKVQGMERFNRGRDDLVDVLAPDPLTAEDFKPAIEGEATVIEDGMPPLVDAHE